MRLVETDAVRCHSITVWHESLVIPLPDRDNHSQAGHKNATVERVALTRLMNCCLRLIA